MSIGFAGGATLLPIPCPHCAGSMLVHDSTVAEITCQLCSRSWECDPAEPGHEQCTHLFSIQPLPRFPMPERASAREA
jgi:hypothetical protein